MWCLQSLNHWTWFNSWVWKKLKKLQYIQWDIGICIYIYMYICMYTMWCGTIAKIQPTWTVDAFRSIHCSPATWRPLPLRSHWTVWVHLAPRSIRKQISRPCRITGDYHEIGEGEKGCYRYLPHSRSLSHCQMTSHAGTLMSTSRDGLRPSQEKRQMHQKQKVNFLPYFHITRKLLLPWQPLTPMPKPLAFKAAEMFYSVLSAQGLKLLVTVPPGREVPHPHSLNVLSTQHGNATLHCQMVPSFSHSKLGLPKNDMAPYGTQKYAAVRKKPNVPLHLTPIVCP